MNSTAWSSDLGLTGLADVVITVHGALAGWYTTGSRPEHGKGA